MKIKLTTPLYAVARIRENKKCPAHFRIKMGIISTTVYQDPETIKEYKFIRGGDLILVRIDHVELNDDNQSLVHAYFTPIKEFSVTDIKFQLDTSDFNDLVTILKSVIPVMSNSELEYRAANVFTGSCKLLSADIGTKRCVLEDETIERNHVIFVNLFVDESRVVLINEPQLPYSDGKSLMLYKVDDKFAAYTFKLNSDFDKRCYQIPEFMTRFDIQLNKCDQLSAYRQPLNSTPDVASIDMFMDHLKVAGYKPTLN